MAKLSKCLLGALSIGSIAANNDYETTSCINADNSRPELSFKVEKVQFESYFKGQEADYTLNGDWYERTIAEEDLTLEFSDEADEITMSYKITPSSDSHSIGGGNFIQFAEDEVVFTCRYPRAVEVAEVQYDIENGFQPQPISGTAAMVYNLSVTAGDVGEMTKMTISPVNNRSEISARVTECRIEDVAGSRTVYPVHSFGPSGDVCFDQRLNVAQSLVNRDFEISFRSFRFTTNGTSGENDAQKQKVSCSLYLYQTDASNPQGQQADDCTCYSPDECANCQEGYSANADASDCEDVDECGFVNPPCDANADCSNTVGSFECSCNDGYQGDGLECADKNECNDDSNDCGLNAECTNTEGSFTCACKAGYKGDGFACSNIDECDSPGDTVWNNCDGNAQCTDTDGSFTCSCNDGYVGDGVTCDNENECETGHNCDLNAQCTDTVGSYECACNDGFIGDGFTCNCEAGYRIDGNTCKEMTAVWLPTFEAQPLGLRHMNQDNIPDQADYTLSYANDISGWKTQIDVGEFGVFGVHAHAGELYYRKGTHEDPYSAGTGWQRLGLEYNNQYGRRFTYVASSHDTIIVLNDHGAVYSFENISFDNSGLMQYDIQAVHYHQFSSSGGMESISIHRGIAWGIASDKSIYRADLSTPEKRRNAIWTLMDPVSGVDQVTIGEYGVFVTNEACAVLYRQGTHGNPESVGTGWNQIPGELCYVSSGFHTLYAVNKGHPVHTQWHQIYKISDAATINAGGIIPAPGTAGPWEKVGDDAGLVISVL